MTELQAMNNSQLSDLAKSLNFNVKGMNKPEMLQTLRGQSKMDEEDVGRHEELTT